MKFLKVIYYIFLAFLGAIALLLLFSIFPITGNIKFMVVESGSMNPTIKTGSIVMVKPSENYKIGDIITFGEYSRLKSPTTHRIFDIRLVEGNPFYITKGDANNAPDQKETQEKDIIGKVLVNVPYLGYAVNFAKKPIGFILIIVVPALLIIYDEIRKVKDEIVKLKKKKKDKEQDKEIQENKKEIEELKEEIEKRE